MSGNRYVTEACFDPPGGRYLGNETLAAPPGVVEALDKERQELPPDQVRARDDPGSLPAGGGRPIQVWWGHEPIVFVIMSQRFRG